MIAVFPETKCKKILNNIPGKKKQDYGLAESLKSAFEKPSQGSSIVWNSFRCHLGALN